MVTDEKLELLNEAGLKEYRAIEQLIHEECLGQAVSTFSEYLKARKHEQGGIKKYLSEQDPKMDISSFRKCMQSVEDKENEFHKNNEPLRKKTTDALGSGWEKFEERRQSAFEQIVAQEKYRQIKGE